MKRLPLIRALEMLRDVRTDEVVVTTMGAAREWPKLSQHPLDFQYLPSAMGHATMIALGIALARPERRVICLTGDGGMLMGLGGLVTIAAARAANLTIVVLDNGLYEVTGGQATAGVAAGCDFVNMALAAGFASAHRYDDLARLGADLPALAAQDGPPGPRLLHWVVASVGEAYALPPPTPIVERVAKFGAALQA